MKNDKLIGYILATFLFLFISSLGFISFDQFIEHITSSALGRAMRTSGWLPIFKVELLQKGFRSVGILGNQITVRVQFTNISGEPIKAFQGKVIVTDILDNKLMIFHVVDYDRVASDNTFTWDGGVEYNQFSDADVRLRGMDKSDLKVVFKPLKVLFLDGSMKEFSDQP
jgi:hypothetical protein